MSTWLACIDGVTDARTDLPVMKQHQVPEIHRGEYNRILEQAYRHAQEVEPKLPMYFYLLKDPEQESENKRVSERDNQAGPVHGAGFSRDGR